MGLHCQVKCQECPKQLTADVSLMVDKQVPLRQMVGWLMVEAEQRWELQDRWDPDHPEWSLGNYFCFQQSVGSGSFVSSAAFTQKEAKSCLEEKEHDSADDAEQRCPQHLLLDKLILCKEQK